MKNEVLLNVDHREANEILARLRPVQVIEADISTMKAQFAALRRRSTSISLPSRNCKGNTTPHRPRSADVKASANPITHTFTVPPPGRGQPVRAMRWQERTRAPRHGVRLERPARRARPLLGPGPAANVPERRLAAAGVDLAVTPPPPASVTQVSARARDEHRESLRIAAGISASPKK